MGRTRSTLSKKIFRLYRINKHILYGTGVMLSFITLCIFTGLENYPLFHAMIETAFIILAFNLLIIASNTYGISHNNHFLFLSVAYGFMSIFTILHVFSYHGTGTILGNANITVQLHTISAYAGSISILILSILFYKNIRLKFVLPAYPAAAVPLIMAVFYWGIFPRYFVEGQGFTFYYYIGQYIILGALAVSAIIIIIKRKGMVQNVFRYMMLSIVSSILSEILCTYAEPFTGIVNMAAHIFKFISVYFMYRLVAETGLKAPYRLLININSLLEEKTAKLQTLNQQLERENEERRLAEEEIKFLSFHDKLTGLYNRALFEEELKRLDTERQLPLSVIMGDLNSLKLANDVFGHKEGDRLLIKIAEILKNSCRKEDVIARWGGDEFIILLPITNHKTVMKICDRIRKTCVEAGDNPIQPSIALGTGTKEKPGQDIQKILNEAEHRMYRNKLIEHKSARYSTIASLERSLLEKSYETREHAERLKELALRMGQALNLADNQLDELSLLAVLHDIGKIAMPDEILMKPGRLSTDEWNTIKKHPEIGFRIAQSSGELSSISEAILSHHERWDGSGYPQGINGSEIPFISRIISIIDAYDVMTHERPYKKAIKSPDALSEIQRCSGSQFDPGLAKVFIKMLSEEAGTPCQAIEG